MAKFKKGDKVRLIASGSRGTVNYGSASNVSVTFDDGSSAELPEFILEPIEPQPDRMAKLEARVAELERAVLQILQP